MWRVSVMKLDTTKPILKPSVTFHATCLLGVMCTATFFLLHSPWL